MQLACRWKQFSYSDLERKRKPIKLCPQILADRKDWGKLKKNNSSKIAFFLIESYVKFSYLEKYRLD